MIPESVPQTSGGKGMPAWVVPAIMSGVSAGAQALGNAQQGKLSREQMERQRLESDRDYDLKLRSYNDALGSQAYTNPFKAMMMNKLSAARGIAAPQGLPDITRYRRPQGYDPRVAENRARIQQMTQGKMFKDDYQKEALRRFDEQVRANGGMMPQNFNHDALHRDLREGGWMDANRMGARDMIKYGKVDGGTVDYKQAMRNRLANINRVGG